MSCHVEVLFTPADFRALSTRNLSNTTCIVFDVLRATSTMVTALANGALGVLPVSEIAEAVARRAGQPEVLLAGERGGLRITAALSHGVEFDLGNSPREYTNERVSGKFIVSTTTNGTRALQACSQAARVLVSSFLNLGATADYLAPRNPEHVCIVCAGTGEETALEDTLAAGALCDQLKSISRGCDFADSALIAHGVFLEARQNLAHAIGQARNARRLLSHPELRDDVDFCLRLNALPIVAARDTDGFVRRVP
jgi:2-phosphosulfolactate phosphatase